MKALFLSLVLFVGAPVHGAGWDRTENIVGIHTGDGMPLAFVFYTENRCRPMLSTSFAIGNSAPTARIRIDGGDIHTLQRQALRDSILSYGLSSEQRAEILAGYTLRVAVRDVVRRFDLSGSGKMIKVAEAECRERLLDEEMLK
jgi:hypothetical protein